MPFTNLFTSAALENEISQQLWSKLSQGSLSSKVSSCATELNEFFNLSGTPFFREYTDHSFKHSIDVFKTACELISPDAVNTLSSEDVNILLMSCIVHDAGLHITEDIFLALTDNTNVGIICPAFDTESWPTLWSDFVAEAKRFNAKKLISLFGDAEPIREPPRSVLELNQRDRLLIGEFLRRHHPRYAHEFSLGLTASAVGSRLDLLKYLDHPWRDIIGLIARSHGMPLRSTFDYLQGRYHIRDFNRAHIVYLMVGLRIADYLQIQSARAPRLFQAIHNIRSPFSSGEWRVHQSVEYATTSSLDPEAIHVAANPLSIQDYLRLEKWTLGFQEELDRSWAVLGEVYGRFDQEGLDKLKLRIRRLRSNIEDKKLLQEQVKYVPELIRFTVAEPELLKLLMGPLYSDNPLYGLRELTQNAADSVKELQHLIATGTPAPIDRIRTDADIEISLSSEGANLFTIKDRGTGMTLEIIKEFFLRAGASFRNSDSWKKQFIDEAGTSKVSRAGRFGVGALSAFLIGDVLTVYTRHFTDKTGFGFKFTARIDDDEIEVLQERGPIGTVIEVESTENRISKMKTYLAKRKYRPFYYVLDNPSIAIKVDLSGVTIEEQYPESAEITASMLALPPKWVSLPKGRYENIKWDRTLRKAGRYWSHLGGYLYCNGILIGEIEDPSKGLLISNEQNIGNVWDINAPTVLITDNSATLPLDLARKGLSSPDPELTNSLMRSMWEDLIASLFFSEATSPQALAAYWMSGSFLFGSEWVPLLFRKQGFSLLDENLLHEAAPSRLIIVRNSENLLERIVDDKFVDDSTLVLMQRFEVSESRSDIANIFQETGYRRLTVPDFKNRRIPRGKDIFSESYVVFNKERFESAFELANYPRYLREVRDNAYELKVGGQEYVIVSRFSSLTDPVVKEIAGLVRRTFKDRKSHKEQRLAVVAGYSGSPTKKTLLWEAWQESILTNYIPYSKNERASVLKSDAPIKAYKI